MFSKFDSKLRLVHLTDPNKWNRTFHNPEKNYGICDEHAHEIKQNTWFENTSGPRYLRILQLQIRSYTSAKKRRFSGQKWAFYL